MRFRDNIQYAHDFENGKLLSPQVIDGFPFCSDEIFGNEKEFKDYITGIMD